MLTTVLKLPVAVTGDDFEKLNSLTFDLNINGAVGKTGFIRVQALVEDKSYLTIIGGTFYSDDTYTTSLGTKVPVVTDTTTFYYYKIEAQGAKIIMDNIDNICALGKTSYIFGDSSALAGAYIYTKDLYKMNLNFLLVSRNQLLGKVSEIPVTITDLRIEATGLEGDLSELQPQDFTGGQLRFRERLVTGRLRDLADITTPTLILDCPLVTGDIVNLLPLGGRGLRRLEIGNAPLSTSVGTTPYPITCSLNENVFFPTLGKFAIVNLRLARTTLLNTLKSLARTTWTMTDSGVSNGSRVALTTTMTQDEYDVDSEIQAARALLVQAGASANLEVVINFA